MRTWLRDQLFTIGDAYLVETAVADAPKCRAPNFVHRIDAFVFILHPFAEAYLRGGAVIVLSVVRWLVVQLVTPDALIARIVFGQCRHHFGHIIAVYRAAPAALLP